MIVQSVNIGQKKQIEWNKKTIWTGIYKSSVESITLGQEDVELDDVVDRKYHGGIDKACYIYSADHYPFWLQLYPNTQLESGMFGENITVKGLNEKLIYIGDIFRIGGATIQVTQPRQPCFKLGLRFNDQKVLKQFINSDYPGIYVKVLEGDTVKPNDTMELIERQHNSMSIIEIWHLLYHKEVDQDALEDALRLPHLSEDCKSSLRKRIKQA